MDNFQEYSALETHIGKKSSFVAKTLLSVDELPLEFRCVFSSYSYFNRIQSAIFKDVFNTDESIVVSAPTGSGKTVIFELAIVKVLSSLQNTDESNFKIVYVAPMKALCEERLIDWHRKFSNFNLNCISVTGDTDVISVQNLSQHNVIITTPEKWDSLTRRWKNNHKFVESIKLFMVDEVHLLNDESRGPTLEVIVSRMKTIQDSYVNKIRFITVSATIPNIEDIAEWIGSHSKPAKSFWFGEEMRPVKLHKIVHGYNYNPQTSTPFKFDIMLNYKLQSIMLQHSNGKPTLIFCSTRKSVEMTAKHLSQSISIRLNPTQLAIMRETASRITDVTIRELLVHGIACHHAGMLPEIRNIVEGLFRNGQLPVLVTTSTLAMGVNLPAHLVIIKSTKYYANAEYRDYPESTMLQMIGRAGRPQFDTSATAVILTTTADKPRYDNMVSGGQPIESSLHKHLTEHINAEVVLCTITDLGVAMQWISSTYLYIRARKHPKYYGLPIGLSPEQIDKRLLDMCQIEINKLTRVGMITMDQYVNIRPTDAGILMAKYYVHFETMKLFTEVSGTEILPQILGLISRCHEFSDLYLRVNDKKTLNLLNKCKDGETIRFPLSGKIRTLDMKINCMIQAVFGCLQLIQSSLINESQKIMRIGERVANCLAEYLEQKSRCYSALLSAILLSKCFHTRLWEDSPNVCRQLTGIGAILSANLVAAGKTSFKSILESNPRNLEIIIKRKCPMGNTIQKQVKHLPHYTMCLNEFKDSITTSVATISITLHNQQNLLEDISLDPESIMSLLIGDQDNNILLYEKYTHSYMVENPEVVKKLEQKFTRHTKLFAHFISENWVGIDCESNLTIFPKIQPTATKKHTPKTTKAPKKSIDEAAKDKVNAKLNINEKDKPQVRTLIDQYFKISKQSSTPSRTKETANLFKFKKTTKLASTSYSAITSDSTSKDQVKTDIVTDSNTSKMELEKPHSKIHDDDKISTNNVGNEATNIFETGNFKNKDLPLTHESQNSHQVEEVRKTINKMPYERIVEENECGEDTVTNNSANIANNAGKIIKISSRKEESNILKNINDAKKLEEQLLDDSLDTDFENYDNWNQLEEKLLESSKDQSILDVKERNFELTEDVNDKTYKDGISKQDIDNGLSINEGIVDEILSEDLVGSEILTEACLDVASLDEITYGDATFNRDLEQFMINAEREALKKSAAKNKSTQSQKENDENCNTAKIKVISNICLNPVNVPPIKKDDADKQEMSTNTKITSSTPKHIEKKRVIETSKDSIDLEDDKISNCSENELGDKRVPTPDCIERNSINMQINHETIKTPNAKVLNKTTPLLTPMHFKIAPTPTYQMQSQRSYSTNFKNKFKPKVQRSICSPNYSTSSEERAMNYLSKPKGRNTSRPKKPSMATKAFEFELSSSHQELPDLNQFAFTPKKRLSLKRDSNFVECTEPDSTNIIEKSPDKQLKLDTENERKKIRIKWHSPLITSPEFKSSPKYVSKEHRSQPSCSFTITANLGLPAMNHIENDHISNISASTSASGNRNKNVQNQAETSYQTHFPLRRPKNLVNFPITDEECSYANNTDKIMKETQQVFEKYNDFVSNSFLESITLNPTHRNEPEIKVITQDAATYIDKSNKLVKAQKNKLMEDSCKTKDANQFNFNESENSHHSMNLNFIPMENSFENYDLNLSNPNTNNEYFNPNENYMVDPTFTDNLDTRLFNNFNTNQYIASENNEEDINGDIFEDQINKSFQHQTFEKEELNISRSENIVCYPDISFTDQEDFNPENFDRFDNNCSTDRKVFDFTQCPSTSNQYGTNNFENDPEARFQNSSDWNKNNRPIRYIDQPQIQQRNYSQNIPYEEYQNRSSRLQEHLSKQNDVRKYRNSPDLIQKSRFGTSGLFQDQNRLTPMEESQIKFSELHNKSFGYEDQRQSSVSGMGKYQNRSIPIEESQIKFAELYNKSLGYENQRQSRISGMEKDQNRSIPMEESQIKFAELQNKSLGHENQRQSRISGMGKDLNRSLYQEGQSRLRQNSGSVYESQERLPGIREDRNNPVLIQEMQNRQSGIPDHYNRRIAPEVSQNEFLGIRENQNNSRLAEKIENRFRKMRKFQNQPTSVENRSIQNIETAIPISQKKSNPSHNLQKGEHMQCMDSKWKNYMLSTNPNSIKDTTSSSTNFKFRQFNDEPFPQNTIGEFMNQYMPMMQRNNFPRTQTSENNSQNIKCRPHDNIAIPINMDTVTQETNHYVQNRPYSQNIPYTQNSPKMQSQLMFEETCSNFKDNVYERTFPFSKNKREEKVRVLPNAGNGNYFESQRNYDSQMKDHKNSTFNLNRKSEHSKPQPYGLNSDDCSENMVRCAQSSNVDLFSVRRSDHFLRDDKNKNSIPLGNNGLEFQERRNYEVGDQNLQKRYQNSHQQTGQYFNPKMEFLNNKISPFENQNNVSRKEHFTFGNSSDNMRKKLFTLNENNLTHQAVSRNGKSSLNVASYDEPIISDHHMAPNMSKTNFMPNRTNVKYPCNPEFREFYKHSNNN